jgi:hypothetical protein
MSATTRPSAGFFRYLCGAAAIVMTVTGFFSMVGGILFSQLAHSERYIGAIEGGSIALVFAGVTIALKTVERFQMAEDESLTTDGAQ